MVRTRQLLHLLLFVAFPALLCAQGTPASISDHLTGYWEGAFVKNNSYQKLDMQIYRQDTTLLSLQVMEEWHPQFGEFQIPVAIDSLGKISFNTGYGKAIVQLDTLSLELVGSVVNTQPATYVHLKKVPDAPSASYKVEEVTIPSGDIQLYGHLHQPKYAPSKTAIIVVGGRGCGAGNTAFNLYAKLFRKYGASVVAFHKRGNGNSTGDCATATVDDLARDVAAVHAYLKAHPNEYEHIGVLGSSAGGWVMLKASEYVAFDFFIGIVGPSTTVEEQQMQSGIAGADFYGLSAVAKEELLDYTDLLFHAKPNAKTFKKLEALLINAKTNDWEKLLDGTDKAASVEGIPDLWVRRHNYDPTKALEACTVPYLAIYGETDWIVPYQENIQRLNELFAGERKQLLTTVVAPGAEHGTEVKEEYRSLPGNQSYWRFFRIAPQVQIALIDFLKQHQFLE